MLFRSMKCLIWMIMAQWEVGLPEGRDCFKQKRSPAVQRQPFFLNDALESEPIIPPNYCWLHSLSHVPISWRRCWWFRLNGSYGLACFSVLIGRQANTERRKRSSSADCPLSDVIPPSWQTPRRADWSPGLWYSRGVKHLSTEIPQALF